MTWYFVATSFKEFPQIPTEGRPNLPGALENEGFGRAEGNNHTCTEGRTTTCAEGLTTTCRADKQRDVPLPASLENAMPARSAGAKQIPLRGIRTPRA